MTSPRRILIVTRNLPPLVGGMERLNWHMAEQLAINADVHVIGPTGSAAVAPAGVAVREAPLRPLWKFLLRARALARHEARTWKPDIVLAGSGLAAPIARSAARTCGASTVVYVHGLDIAVRNALYRAFWLPAIRSMDRVIANSHATADLCRGIGVDPARIGIVHPGADLPGESLSRRQSGKGGLSRIRGGTEPLSAPSASFRTAGDTANSSFRTAGDTANSSFRTSRSGDPESVLPVGDIAQTPIPGSITDEAGDGPGMTTAGGGPPPTANSSFRTSRRGDPESSALPGTAPNHDANEFRQRHELGNRPLLLSVGRLSARKGLREFVELALPRIVAARPDVMLLIVGDAPTQALHARAQTPSSIQTMADAVGVGRQIKFLGVITDYAELGLVYRAADVHVFPVREIPGDPEGFGMVAVEAAAHGLPTVAFATGGVVDAVAAGQSGHRVAVGDYAGFADAVLRALAERDAMRAPCLEFARQFAWSAFGTQIAAQLPGIVTAAPSRRISPPD
jgi:glycosyltransferase involved in cell wall biosynthesis